MPEASLQTALGAKTEASSIPCLLSTLPEIAEGRSWGRPGKEKPKESFAGSGETGRYKMFRQEMSRMAGESRGMEKELYSHLQENKWAHGKFVYKPIGTIVS